jgi:hypothetical protein
LQVAVAQQAFTCSQQRVTNNNPGGKKNHFKTKLGHLS